MRLFKRRVKMFWKFWEHEKTKAGQERLPRPKSIPRYVGRYMVLDEKRDPYWVWNLKGVVRPTEKESAFYCRVFNEAETKKAGVIVENWNSLDDHLDLIIWEGYFDLDTNTVRPEKFAKP
jgi:hypothetical protein